MPTFERPLTAVESKFKDVSRDKATKKIDSQKEATAERAKTVASEGTPATRALMDEMNALKADLKKVIRVCRSMHAKLSPVGRGGVPESWDRPSEELLRKLSEKFEIPPEIVILHQKAEKRWAEKYPILPNEKRVSDYVPQPPLYRPGYRSGAIVESCR
jgi:hypothetical protein